MTQLAFGLGTSWSKRGDPNISRYLVDTIKMAIGAGFTHMDCSDSEFSTREIIPRR